jgi:hypothetical protein
MTWKTIIIRAMLTLIFLVVGALEVEQVRYLRQVLANPLPPASTASRSVHGMSALPKSANNPCG